MRSLFYHTLLVCVIFYYTVTATDPFPHAPDSSSVGHVDTVQEIQLPSNINIPDGGEFYLPIEVPAHKIAIDGTTSPKIVQVSSPHADGTFGIGEEIDIHVEFTSAVDVTGTDIHLVLATGCHTEQHCRTVEVQRLTCTAESGKFALSFDGQTVHNIPYDATPVVVKSYIERLSKIKRVDVQFTTGNMACTAESNDIIISFTSVNIDGTDGDLPAMEALAWNTGGDGTFLTHRNEALTELITPLATEVVLGVKYTDRTALYVDKVDTKTLRLRYTVTEGDATLDLDYVSTDSLVVAASTSAIYAAGSTGVAADLTLPVPGSTSNPLTGAGSSLGANSAIVIDVSVPVITEVTSSRDSDTYSVGDVIPITVRFSLPVTVSGSPYLQVETGDVDRSADYQGLQDSDYVMLFHYTVQVNDESLDLELTSSTTGFQLNGGTVFRTASPTATASANVTLPLGARTIGSLSFNKDFVIDSTVPVVESIVGTTADGTYAPGDVIQFNVHFTERVAVTGTPVVYLSTGSVDLFPGEFIKSVPTDGDASVITLFHIDHGLTTEKDGGHQFMIGSEIMTLLTVSGDVLTMSSGYTGTAVVFQDFVAGSSPLTSISTPGYRAATYTSGTGTKDLIFSYTVVHGDVSADLDITSTSALSLNSGTIKRSSDASVTDATLTLPAPASTDSLGANAAYVVDSTAPVVTSVTTSIADGTYRIGEEIDFTVEFSLPVSVLNAASILMDVTAAERYAFYISGSGSTSLLFRYTVQDGESSSDLNYDGTVALKPWYGSTIGYIRRTSTSPTTNAILTLPANAISSVKNIKIDSTTAPYVTSVTSSTIDGVYGVGQDIDIILEFSVLVNVVQGGSPPSILLETGPTDRTATYTSGSGSTSLVFTYTVQVDDESTDLNYESRLALSLNGGTIQSAGTVDAVIVLPDPSSTTSSLAATKQIQISTTGPVVSKVWSYIADGEYGEGQEIDLILTFDKAVTVADGTPTLQLETGDTDQSAVYQGFDSNQIYFKYTVQANDGTSNLDYRHANALRCTLENGVNRDGTKDASKPAAVEFASGLYLTWVEMAATNTQIRVAKFNGRLASPLWDFVDGGLTTAGINKASTEDATSPTLIAGTVSGTSKLFVLWTEVSAGLSTSQIRVAVYNGDDDSPAWTFVDVGGATNGINKDTTKDAEKSVGIINNDALYAAWHENDGTRNQIRVAKYNGNDGSPSWSFVDGDHATNGLNFDATKAANNVHGISRDTTKLLVAWEEDSGTATQIRVKIYNGDGTTPLWSFVDGNLATGINVDKSADASLPYLVTHSEKTYIAWHETTGSNTRVYVSVFNEDEGSPSWTRVDGGSGLNFDSSKDASSAKLAVHDSELYAMWSEENSNSVIQLRAAKYNSDDNNPSWTVLDLGIDDSVINHNSAYAATSSHLVSYSGSGLIATWQEPDGSAVSQVHISLHHENTDDQWTSMSYGCIKEAATTATLPATLTLPSIGTYGSLGQSNSITVDTTSPLIERVSALEESTTTLGIAETKQSIDIYADSAITAGSFKITYGSEESACIDWDAAADTDAGSIKTLFESISTIDVTVDVAKDSNALANGHRYSLTFTNPTVAIQEIGVSTNGCTAFSCTDDASADCVTTAINSEVSVSDMQSGVMNLGVYFNKPVSVGGSPVLQLETGTVDRDAVYSPASVIQSIDVGASAPSAILSGEYKLSYGGTDTGCIDFGEGSSLDFSSLKSQIETIPAALRVGISSIERAAVGNGYRYTVTFAKGNPEVLAIADSSACNKFAGTIQTIDIYAGSAISAGSYKILHGTLESTCISYNAPATGVGSMQETIEAMGQGNLRVSVTKNPSLFSNGNRYYVEFSSAEQAKVPLIVDATGCVDFSCGGGVCSDEALETNADYVAAVSPSNVASFRYTIQAGDSTGTSALDYTSTSALTGGTFKRVSTTPTTDAVQTLPLLGGGSSLSASGIIVEGSSAPTVSSVSSSTDDGTYGEGDIINIDITFSESVVVTGSLQVILNINSLGTSVAKYASGSGTTTLNFKYIVLSGDTIADLDLFSTTALKLNGGSILSSANSFVEADIELPIPGAANSLGNNKAIVLNTDAPTITGVSSNHADNTGEGYGAGEVIDIVVSFDKELTVTGVPTILLETGAVDTSASFSLAGRTQHIDVGIDILPSVSSGEFQISYGGVTSGCITYNDEAELETKLLEIPSVAQIGISSVSKSNLDHGHRFTVVFDDADVNSAPLEIETIQPVSTGGFCEALSTGSVNDLNYLLVKRNVGSTMTFRYTVATGDVSSDLDFVDGSISLNGGTVLQRTARPSTAADLTLPTAGGAQSLSIAKNIKIDGVVPTVSSITVHSSSGTYGLSSPAAASPSSVLPGQISFSLVYSHTVKVEGTPTIELQTGSTGADNVVIPNRFATYQSGSLSTTLLFLYTIEAGDASADLDFASASALSFGDGGSIVRVSTNNDELVDKTLPYPGLAAVGTIIVDSTAASIITKVSSNHSDGQFGYLEEIFIQVDLSKQVQVQTGLNADMTYSARQPNAIEFNSKLYVFWSESAAGDTQTLRGLVYDDSTAVHKRIDGSRGMLNAETTATFISGIHSTVFNSKLYVTWSEDGKLYVCVYNNDDDSPSWSILPIHPLNVDITNEASSPNLVVHESKLYAIWSEMSSNVQQIFLRVYNGDDSKPNWNYIPTTSLNKNNLANAISPKAVVFRGEIHAIWTEETSAGSNLYTTQVCQYNLVSEVCQYVTASGLNSDLSKSASSPTLVVTNEGSTSEKLHAIWKEATAVSHVNQVYHSELNHSSNYTWGVATALSSSTDLNDMDPHMFAIDSILYAGWVQESELKVMSYDASSYGSSVGTWSNHTISGLNHNGAQHSRQPTLTEISNSLVLVWNEYDGVSYKLRMKVNRGSSWEEILFDVPRLLLETGTTDRYANFNDYSGEWLSTLNFKYVVQTGDLSADLEVQSSTSLDVNNARLKDGEGLDPVLTMTPGETDLRSLANNNDIVIDTSVPIVTQVTSDLADGTYGAGQVIQIKITFSAKVVVVMSQEDETAAVVPQLKLLNRISGPSVATYVDGSGTDTLLFDFSVPVTFPSQEVSYEGVTSLELPSANVYIRQASTTPTINANLELPTPGSGTSLSGSKSLVINTAKPTVLSVSSSTVDGTYYVGDTIEITVTFSDLVIVYLEPTLLLNTGYEVAREALYESGNGTTEIVFHYTVATGEDTSDLSCWDDRDSNSPDTTVNALQISAASYITPSDLPLGIMRLSTVPTTPVNLKIPAPEQANSLKTAKTLALDSAVPSVSRITTTKADGTYDLGEVIEVQVHFTTDVVVTNVPLLYMSTGNTASYSGGSDSTILTFSYTVQEGDTVDTLDYLNTESLFLLDTTNEHRPILGDEAVAATIKRKSSNPTQDANLTLTPPGSTTAPTVSGPYSMTSSGNRISLRTDGVRVTAVSTTSTSNGTVAEGEVILVDVSFGGAVAVAGGTPQIVLNTAPAQNLLYVSGSGTTDLTFSYTVQAGDTVESLAYASTTALELSGSTITAVSDGKNVPLTLPEPGEVGSLSYQKAIKVDTSQPVVTNVSSPTADGTYGVGDEIQIQVTWNFPVSIDGANPTLTLETGGTDRDALYFSGDATSSFLFLYTVQAGDTALEKLDYVATSSLVGSLLATSTTPTTVASNTLAAPGATSSLGDSSTIIVDTTAPTVAFVRALHPNGTYKAGDQLTLEVEYSTAVITEGDITLTLDTIGVSNRVITMADGGSGTSSLRFVYTVQEGDATSRLDYVSTSSLSGTIKRSSTANSGQIASRTLPAPGAVGSLGHSSEIRINPTAPKVISVTSDEAAGTYGALAQLDIQITFSAAVTVIGSPTLSLSIPNRKASYNTGSGTTILTFTYTVQEGDMALPLEYDSIYALLETASTTQIQSASNTNILASLTLPIPGASGSLSSSKELRIDTIPPKVIRTRFSTSDGSYGVGQEIDIILHFSAPVQVTGSPTLLLETGATDREATYVSGSDTEELLFTYVVQDGDATDRLDYKRVCSAQNLLSKSVVQLDLDCVELSADASALALNGGSSKRSSDTPTTDALLMLPEPNSWPTQRVVSSTESPEYTTIANASEAFTQLKLGTAPTENEVLIVKEKTSVVIFSNGIPDHAFPNDIELQNYVFELNRFPSISASRPDRVSGIVGIMLNGIPIVNSESAGSIDNNVDECGGAIFSGGAYRYVATPSCLIEEFGNDAVLGYALDGFPIYGPETSESPNLDSCYGTVDSSAGYQYHLLTENTAKGNFIGCFNGDYSTGGNNPLMKTSEVATIAGLNKVNFKSITAVVADDVSSASPWINADSVTVTYTTSAMLVYSNGIPDDGDHGTFPNDYNPYAIANQNYIFSIPLFPTWSSTTTALTTAGPIGVFINGIPFWSAYSATGEDIMDETSSAYEVMDKCNAHVDSTGAYHYHASPDCLLDKLDDVAGKESALIGYAFDGYPIYGPYGEDGALATGLDSCNGKVGIDGDYRYHVTATAPYTIGCFHGVVPSVNADTLAFDLASNYLRSLSYTGSIKIDTASPVVTSVSTNKHPGTYTAGEVIDILVTFSSAVVVSGGTPYVTLDTGTTPAQAPYSLAKSTSTTLAFEYTVGSTDLSVDLNYVSSDSLNLNGAAILRDSTTPATAANLDFITPNASTTLGAKASSIQNIEIALNGLYHQHASDIQVELLHGDRVAKVINGCCADMSFGKPNAVTKQNALHLQASVDSSSSGAGYNYHFADIQDVNQAVFGTATQSSTAYGASASRAIDGNRNGFFSSLSVTHTSRLNTGYEAASPNTTSWWQLKLASPMEIGTINLWNREQEVLRHEVQKISVDALVPLAGSFTITCTFGAESLTTESISVDAVASVSDENEGSTALGVGAGESLEAKLEALSNVGDVRVSRSAANALGGYEWTVTFLTNPGNLNKLEVGVDSITSEGSSITVTTIVEGSDNVWYNYNNEIVEISGSLFPCWVMIFDENNAMAFDSLEDAKQQAIFKKRLTVVQRQTGITLPSTVRGQFIRVQLEGIEISSLNVVKERYLSIAEVEVYEFKNRALSFYEGGNPVSAVSNPGGLAWAPEESFEENFSGMSAVGTWLLRIKDTATVSKNLTTSYSQPLNGVGGISDWTLTITSAVGKTSTYYMDMTATIETLPEYGDLYIPLLPNEQEYLDADSNGYLDASEATRYLSQYIPLFNEWDTSTRLDLLEDFINSFNSFGGTKVPLKPGYKRPRVPCLDSCEFGTSAHRDPGAGGDVAGHHVIGKDRVIRYVPRESYAGSDTFTYSIRLGNSKSQIDGTVYVDTVKCLEEGTCISELY